jgi:hypothetical protein
MFEHKNDNTDDVVNYSMKNVIYKEIKSITEKLMIRFVFPEKIVTGISISRSVILYKNLYLCSY